jgi:hypothetical protein
MDQRLQTAHFSLPLKCVSELTDQNYQEINAPAGLNTETQHL